MAFGVKNIVRKQKEHKVSKAPKPEHKKLNLWVKLKNKLRTYKRVLKITKKPGSKEFKMIVKVTSLGIAAIGAIGFVVWIILTFLE